MNSTAKTRHSTKLAPLEFRVWRELEACGVQDGRVLVACSGGRDSIALLHVLNKLALRLKLTLIVAHVHHGPSASPGVARAREQALEVVKAAAAKLDLRLHVARVAASISNPKTNPKTNPHTNPRELRSEGELRNFRHRALRTLARKERAAWIAFGHHADDLLETRLIRLIRGTGATGLRAMRVLRGAKVRPFLEIPRVDLETYMIQRRLSWFEDPTNQETGPLRNWLRHSWLQELNAKRPGSRLALARSLQHLTDALADSVAAPMKSSGAAPRVRGAMTESVKVLRSEFATWPLGERRNWLLQSLSSLGARNFSTNHVRELEKRLSSKHKPSQNFIMVGVDIALTRESIEMRRTGQ